MIRFSELFPEIEIVATLSQVLSWSHFVELVKIDDNLKRSFYTEICRLERWSVRTLTKKNELSLFPDLVSSGKINAAFVTSTNLSTTAKKFALALGVKVIENKPLEKYPLIKCNIGVNGDKIYHLPFDQQYDKTLINKQGEFYALTVKEAEDYGFRRAFRWQGTNDK